MTGSWEPAGTWNRIHGDGKSTTGGKFHLETMTASNGTYKVRLVGSDITLEYATAPSFNTIVTDLKAKV